jgi:hypothetical protein
MGEYDEGEIDSPVLTGVFDVAGLVSLMLGFHMLEKPAISCYFDAADSKFVNGRYGIQSESDAEKSIFGTKSIYTQERFNAMSNKTHASLWFARKAFTEEDRSTKVILYYTALELIVGKNVKNHFAKLYHKRVGDPIGVITRFNELRDNLVHNGVLPQFSKELERYILAGCTRKAATGLSGK